jgi:hypothetical protein
MRQARALLLPVVIIIAAGACRRPAEPWTVVPTPLETPAAANTSLPNMTVSSRGTILSWVERAGPTTTLKFAERGASGWTAAKTVSAGSDWFVSYADPPAVLRLSNGTLVAQWLQQIDPRLEAMNLLLSYSRDEGATWSAPFSPHHDGTTTQHAFASLFELPGSALGLVWLDGRESLIETDDPAGGAMTMHYAAFDAGWKQTAEAAVDHRVCECCSTAVATTSDGVVTAYRDRSGAEIRDIAVSRLDGGGWSPAVTVHDDGWKTYACPVNGPAISARGRQLAVAWFSAVNDEGHAFAAFSNDAGRTWSAPIRLDDAASLGRVDVELLEDGSAVATWVEFAEGRSELRLRRVETSGARSGAVRVGTVPGGSSSGFPRMARDGATLVFAWTESTPGASEADVVQHVRTASAVLPE